MNDCGHDPSELVALLRDDVPPERRRLLAGRVDACEACAGKLRALRRTWDELPTASGAEPPADARNRALAHARDVAAAPARVVDDLWRAVRPAVVPATVGVAAAAAVVLVLHLGGGLAVRRHIPVLALGLALAALLSGAAGGLWTAAPRRTSRAVLLGGLGSLGGYLVLSLLHPIPSAVEFCRVRVFGDPAMTLGQVCLVYAGVAALYAGVPVGVTAFFSSSGGDGWKVGLAEAAVFTLLALPVLGLQFGLENVAVTGTVLGGAALGAAAGGLAGGVARNVPWAIRAAA